MIAISILLCLVGTSALGYLHVTQPTASAIEKKAKKTKEAKEAKGNMMNNVLYYQEEFQNGSKADREKICEQADTGLRKLQKPCPEKEESRKILQILAVNSEYQENYENAGFYYEQMLLYDETYRAGYGEYG